MSLPVLIAVLTVVVGIPLNVYVLSRLWNLHRRAPELKTLVHAVISSAGVLLLTVVFGVVFWNNDNALILFNGEVARYVTRGAVLLLATVPALYWLWIYRGRERDEVDEAEARADAKADASTDRIVAAIENLPGQGGEPQDVTIVQPSDQPVPAKDADKS